MMKLPISLCDTTDQKIVEFVPQMIDPIPTCQCPIEDNTFTPMTLEVLCYCPTPPPPRTLTCVPSITTTTKNLVLDNLLAMIHNKYCLS